MMNGILRMPLCLLLPLLLASGVTSECLPTASVCEFWLEISQRLTMMHGRHAVFPEAGRLFLYNVTDTSRAETVDPRHVITTDGWETQRVVIVANGTMPGPALEVYENQTVVVHVTNKLSSTAVTVHWHGMHQHHTPWMDGVAYVTQCPIQPHNSFTYVFKASPRGTFWYHSHIGSQLAMGLIGPLIVRDRGEPDMEEHILMVQEWNHHFDADLVMQRMTYGAYDNRVRQQGSRSLEGASFSLFPFDSALINGRGRYYYSNGSHNGAPLSSFDVEPGRDYRFRVIGSSALYPFRVSVDGHQLLLVASDGYEVVPVPMESIIVNPGERYDFVLTANQPAANYWVRAETLEVNVCNHRADAILHYSTAPLCEPWTHRRVCSQHDRCLVVNCPFHYYPADQHTDCLTVGHLRSLHDPMTPGVTTNPSQPEENIEDIFLNFGFPGTTFTPGSVNGRYYEHHPVSALTQPADLRQTCDPELCGEDKICHCPYSITLEHNKVYNLIFSNMGVGRGWNHPIHLHGHSFHVIKTGYPEYNKTTGRLVDLHKDNPDIDCRGNPDRSLTFCNSATWANSSWGGNNIPGAELQRPPRKDTVQCPTGGYVVVRLRADNPGLWFLHCHVGLHAEDGMTLTFNESFSRQPPPPRGFPTCGHFQIDREELLSLVSLSNEQVADADDKCDVTKPSRETKSDKSKHKTTQQTKQQTPQRNHEKSERFEEFRPDTVKSGWLENQGRD